MTVQINPDFTAEQWLPVVGFEGAYEVSDLGRVCSLDRMIPNGAKGMRLLKGRVLRDLPHPGGYRMVALSVGCKVIKFLVHRLVAAAFLPNENGCETVSHIDHDKRNNRLSNLEWATQSENLARSGKLGRLSDKANNKLSAEMAAQIRVRFAAGETLSQLATAFNVAFGTIGKIVRGERWAHVKLAEPLQETAPVVPLTNIKETWKPAAGYAGRYLVSSYGRVFSLVRNQILSLRKRPDGYLSVMLTDGTFIGRRVYQVHRLVAIAFLGQPPVGRPDVNHRDCDRANNRVENLEWVSKSVNTRHAVKAGRFSSRK